MRTIAVKLLKFDELEDLAKERARDWYRQGALDYEWWDCTFEDAKQVFALAGFHIKDIYFSGFSSQGDGACFTGHWCAVDAKPIKAMREHAPKDTELHRIAKECRRLARLAPGAIATIAHRGRGNHEGCTDIGVDLPEPDEADDLQPVYALQAKGEDLEEAIIEVCRDAMRWIYRQLEREHDYMMSDEQVDESISANEYEFTEEGARA